MDMFKILSLPHNTGLVNELWHESILSHDNLDQPSQVPKDQHVQVDKENSELFRNTRVLTVIPCQECTKPRCVFAAKVLSTEEKAAIAIIDDSLMFSCGMPMLVSESPLHKTIVVCQKITRTSPIEAQYYSAKLVKLSPVCYWCGAPEETLVRVTELQCQFQIVRSICFLCLGEGKQPYTSQSNNMAKCCRVT